MFLSSSSTEEDSSNVKDKASKIAFLEKIIALIQSELNAPIHAQPKRIVSGLEPENTCHFLQMLVVAAISYKEQQRDEARDVDEGSISHDAIHISEEGCERNNTESVNNKANFDDAQREPIETGDSKKGVPENENLKTDYPAVLESNVSEDIPEQAENENNCLEDRIKNCNSDMDRTRKMISDIISKPRCTEKLLNKPPFRYLHDLITAIAQETGVNLDFLR